MRALADPGHPLHDSMLEFDDPDFDPHKVDAGALARGLAEVGRYIGRRKTGSQ